MQYQRKKRIALWLCALALAAGLVRPVQAMSLSEQGPAGASGPAEAFTVQLGGMTVSNGVTLRYETVAPQLAGNPFAEGYYPGELTVELSGQIVIEAGGILAIGTLSHGSDEEASPVIRGALRPDGMIVVRPGGKLILKDISADLSGRGFFIVQDPGGSVEIDDTALDENLLCWAPPMVDNSFHPFKDLWLEAGTPLTAEVLPDDLQTYLQYQGQSQWTTVPVAWDLSKYAGQTDGELKLSGQFLSDSGDPLPALRPPELPSAGMSRSVSWSRIQSGWAAQPLRQSLNS